MRRDPTATAARPSPTSALQYFTNREGFLQSFTRHRDTPAGEDLSVLVFYGVGGIGKTTLVRKLCADLAGSPTPLPFARFNLENISDPAQAYRDVLLRLRSDLESEGGVKFPRFDLALAVLLATEGGERPSLVQVSDGLGNAFSAAMELTPSFVKAGAKLAARQLETVIRRSEPLERWVRHVGGTAAVLELSERLAQDDQIVQDELIRRFAEDLAELPVPPGKMCRAVLFLDTYEALWTGRDSLGAQARGLEAWVRLLAEYLLGAGVLLVIAGRDRLGWGDGDPEWEPCLDQHLLGGVSGPDAQTFLARRGIGVPPPDTPDPLQAAILHCANTAARPEDPPSCHLLALALSADIVLNTRAEGHTPDPDLFRNVPPARMAGELAARFLKSLHNRSLELWVEALSLTPRFDEAAALALDAERRLGAGRAGWEQLRHYSFVSAQPDGFFRMHRTMRAQLRGRSSPDLSRTLHAWFEGHWQAQGEDGLAFYHRWSLDPDGALDAWEALHTSALDILKIGEARGLLTRWAEVALDDDDRAGLSARTWARTHAALGESLRKTPLNPSGERLARAIEHFGSALSVWTEAETPQEWASAQNGLGQASLNLPTGDRAESLRRAEEHLQAAGRVWTERADPPNWAKLQSNLGIACAYRPTGDRTGNIGEASDFFQAALRVWTRAEWPQEWAKMHNNLGCNCLLLPTGDRGENLRRAAAYFEANLQVQTRDTVPENWAKTQHNLGIVYLELPDGNRGENLQRAIGHYRAALSVHTEADLPDVWAETQNCLGNALSALADEEPGASRRPAIDCFEAAQRVWTEGDNPDRWAQAQTNKGDVLAKLTGGDRAENLRDAISCFRDAQRVHTEESFPEHSARAQKGLGRALQSLAAETGDARAAAEAPACFAAAARGYRAAGFPAEAEEAERLAQTAPASAAEETQAGA